VIWVLEAKPFPDYRLQVRFSDNSAGVVDLKSFIFADQRPIVAALREASLFAAMRVEFDTVVWPNGFDLAPEFLRSRLVSGVAA
jgi:Protein of unknown function (DUF2442)